MNECGGTVLHTYPEVKLTPDDRPWAVKLKVAKEFLRLLRCFNLASMKLFLFSLLAVGSEIAKKAWKSHLPREMLFYKSSSPKDMLRRQ